MSYIAWDLLGASCVVTGVIVFVVALVVACRKTWRRVSEQRYRFSSKALLLFVGLLACLCGGLRIMFGRPSLWGICYGLPLVGASFGALLGFGMRGPRCAAEGAVAGLCTVSAIVGLIALAETYG